MLVSNRPTKFPAIWGSSAVAPYINTIPVPSQQGIRNGAASFTDGFPPNCFIPYASGGAGPFGGDTNGILNQITAGVQWQQAGGSFMPYDATFQTTVGGYFNGAYVASATVPGRIWRSTVDNNLTNPDTGGAGWVLAFLGRLLNMQRWFTPGTAIYTPTAGTSTVIWEVQGAGAGGGGCTVPAVGAVSLGAPGGAGSYGMIIATVAQSTGQTVTVGLGGAAPVGGPGSAGGASAVSGLISCPGGIGGGQLNSQTPPTANGNGSLSFAVSFGAVTVVKQILGSGGTATFAMATTASGMLSGTGGASAYGGGAPSVSGNATPGGAVNAGSGGGGSVINNGFGGSIAGSAGANGYVIAWEYS